MLEYAEIRHVQQMTGVEEMTVDSNIPIEHLKGLPVTQVYLPTLLLPQLPRFDQVHARIELVTQPVHGHQCLHLQWSRNEQTSQSLLYRLQVFKADSVQPLTMSPASRRRGVTRLRR